MKLIRDYCSKNTQVLLSGIINGEDGNYNDKISEINTRLASYSEQRRIQGVARGVRAPFFCNHFEELKTV